MPPREGAHSTLPRARRFRWSSREGGTWTPISDVDGVGRPDTVAALREAPPVVVPGFDEIGLLVSTEGLRRGPRPPPADPCAFVLEAVARATATDHFVISAERVLALAAQRGLDPQNLLPEFVREAQKLAIPPTSKFHVGAAALGASGAVYLGVNVELPGLP